MELVDYLPHISLAAEVVFHVGSFPVTNSLIATWLCMALLIVVSWLATRRMKLVPTGLQNVVETIIEIFYEGIVRPRAGERAGLFLPLAGTCFFFILLSNWMGLLPGFGSIGLLVEHHGERELVPLLRSANTDLNTTLALALFSVIATQIYGIKVRGFFGYANRFIRVGGFVDFFKRQENPMMLANAAFGLIIGLLEIVDELTKLLSFSFRLFGNIFAGEVLLIVVSMLLLLLKQLLPIIEGVLLIVLGLELFVGFIQALIFTTLTLVFMTHATHEEGEGH